MESMESSVPTNRNDLPPEKQEKRDDSTEEHPQEALSEIDGVNPASCRRPLKKRKHPCLVNKAPLKCVEDRKDALEEASTDEGNEEGTVQ
jgi:hypothetical protein